jgi:hypothetical protein
VFKHLFARFTCWRGSREVDLAAEIGGDIIPFEAKYRARHTGARELKGLLERLSPPAEGWLA